MHAVNFFRGPKLLMSKARLTPDFLEKLYFASVGYLAWLQDKKNGFKFENHLSVVKPENLQRI